LDLVLIPRLNIVGAAIASTASYSVAAFLLVFFFIRETGVSFARGAAAKFGRSRACSAIGGAAAETLACTKGCLMRKKVLFIPSWFPNPEDPISGVFIQEQAVALSKYHDVVVLIPGMAAWRNVANRKATDRSSKESQVGLTVYREFARPLIPHGPESIDYGTFARAAENGFKKIVKEWGTPDIIHTHVVLPAGWSAMKVAKRYGIPIVLTEHSGPFSMHLGTELSRKLARETLTGVDGIIAISPNMAKQLLDFQRDFRYKSSASQ
jgi:hypothetical protein